MEDYSLGIRRAVLWFQSRGFTTTDSGDGSNYVDGMEGALEYKHVAIQSKPYQMVQDANVIRSMLVRQDAGGLIVEASYSPNDGVAVIMVMDPDNTGGFEKL